MSRLNFTFADPSAARLYPAHGWALNDQGVSLLWMPFLRQLALADSFRKAEGLTPLDDADWHAIWSCHRIFEKLAVTLRELRRTSRSRIVAASEAEADPKGSEATRDNLEILPLYADLAIVYLRRVGDHIAHASRGVLFADVKSAPQELKKLQKTCGLGNRSLEGWGPICAPEALRATCRDHLGWFDELRTVDGRTGIRNFLEHHFGFVEAHAFKTGEQPWVAEAIVRGRSGAVAFSEVLSRIETLVEGLCAFLTGLHSIVAPTGTYVAWVVPYGDCLLLPSSLADHDLFTGFWPPISKAATTE